MSAYTYFPGCSLRGTAREYDLSVRAVFGALGVSLNELDGWVCCGATSAHSTSRLLATSLAAANLAKAARQGNNVVAACASCYSRLLHGQHDLESDPALAAKVRAAGVQYEGNVAVLHVLDLLLDDVGLKAIEERVHGKLKGLTVACYYGCLITRPRKLIQKEDPEHPHRMDDVLRACGATCVEWAFANECCGGGLAMARPDVVAELSHRILADASAAGADLVAVACPMCQTNLEMRQADIRRTHGVNHNLPVVYFTQLLGVALGLDQESLGLNRLLINPMPRIRERLSPGAG